MLCILWCFSAHHSCREWLFDPFWPSHFCSKNLMTCYVHDFMHCTTLLRYDWLTGELHEYPDLPIPAGSDCITNHYYDQYSRVTAFTLQFNANLLNSQDIGWGQVSLRAVSIITSNKWVRFGPWEQHRKKYEQYWLADLFDLCVVDKSWNEMIWLIWKAAQGWKKLQANWM